MLSSARSETSIRSYLPHSVAATSTVLAIPLAIVWVTEQADYFTIPATMTALMAFGFMALGFIVGAKLWEGAVGSEDISFGELMLWSWYRLAQADDRIAEFRMKAARVDASPEEQLAVLHELSDTLESKDPYTRGHSGRVERHALNIAAAMGLSFKEIDVLRKSASMHDVGKVRIPNRVLHKNGPLDADERALIEEHPVLGAWMVSAIGDREIVATVRHHHERWDGAGYPDGISGADIPLFSRIIAVADTFDAITSTRSYRAGSSRPRAIQVIKAESGKQFDPVVVDAFLSTLPERSSTLAAALMFGAEPALRNLAQWFRHFGSGAVAPGLATMGAAIVLGTATFVAAPAASEPRADAGRTQAVAVTDLSVVSPAAAHDRSVTNDRVLGTHLERKRARKSNGSRPAKKDAPRDLRRKGGANEPSLATAPAKASGGGKQSAQQAPAPVVKAPVAPAPAPPAPEPVNEVNDALADIDDPKTGKGKDCDPGLGNTSKGSKLHCN